MKNLITIFLFSSSFLLLTPSQIQANHFLIFLPEETVQENFAVVIGAFAIHRNAERFTNHAQSLSAKYEFNPNRNLYYVYTLTTNDKEIAMTEARRLRVETIYTDAWVFQRGSPELQKAAGQDINPITDKQMEVIPVNKEPEVTQTEPEPKVTSERKSVFTPKGEEERKFYFKFYNATNSEPINGEVLEIDADRTRKIGAFKTNETVNLPSPKNSTGNITLVSNTFGYRKVLKQVNFVEPEGEDIIIDPEKGVVVPFEMVRLRKGDIVVMYNVFFFKDAAVMLPESRFEVENLLSMMKENPKCRIRIHGHTNGGGAGKIISAGSSKNYFSLSGTTESVGSAKALSEERAKIIRSFLIDNGISESRTEIKAWGGKRPLYDKDSQKAKENVRVEIEILED